jgi:hypothetical protein
MRKSSSPRSHTARSAPKAMKTEELCRNCLKPAGPPRAAKCAVCKSNGWRRLCDQCQEGRLLECDSCKEQICGVCMVPEGAEPFDGAVGSDSWNPPCSDPKHKGPKVRLCNDCLIACTNCDQYTCDRCFRSLSNWCRVCVAEAHNELKAFDAKDVPEQSQK